MIRRMECSMGAYLQQLENGAVLAAHHHSKMIALGFTWDGQDGYLVPEGMTVEQCKQLWSDSVRECQSKGISSELSDRQYDPGSAS